MSLKMSITESQLDEPLESRGSVVVALKQPRPKRPRAQQPVLLQSWALVLSAEIALCAISFLLTLWILPGATVQSDSALLSALLMVLSARTLFLYLLGPFRGSLRHGSVHELLAITKAISCSSLLMALFINQQVAGGHGTGGVLVLDWALCQLLLGALHFGARMYQSQAAAWHKPLKRIAVVGAGDAGATLVRELASDPNSRYRPTAIFDDNPKTHGTTICGVPVIGKTDLLHKAARARAVDEVLICIPSATSVEMSRLFTICCQSGLPVRTLPTLAELVDGNVSMRDLRNFRIGDLLQRQEVQPDPREMAEIVRNRIVLVTGAGGSIGSELSRQIAAAGPERLLLLDKTENSLFYIDRELREKFPRLRIDPLLVDVTNRLRIDEVFSNYQPAIVFHAAAHKHVGLLELHPSEAIRNNVLGTRNVAVAAHEHKAERFVNISSDKAVNPENYMGLSKKLTELCIQNLAARHTTRFINVRFGNVAGSTGSVVRLFWEHIQKGEPLHVTDPRATRFFMSIPEAVHLILRAAAHGQGGETFVLEMGEPINIYELAKSMSLLAGLAPGKELPIHFVGLRDGEKINEELWTDWENPVPSPQKGIHVLEGRDPLAEDILSVVEILEQEVNSNAVPRLIQHLNLIFPSFAAKRSQLSRARELVQV
jgi:FlaA1/EpsC-like NDP-sugar epimerase